MSGVVCNNDFSFSPTRKSIPQTSGNYNVFNSMIYVNCNENGVGCDSKPQPDESPGIRKYFSQRRTEWDVSRHNSKGLTSADQIILKNNIMTGMGYCMDIQDAGTAAALKSD